MPDEIEDLKPVCILAALAGRRMAALLEDCVFSEGMNLQIQLLFQPTQRPCKTNTIHNRKEYYHKSF